MELQGWEGRACGSSCAPMKPGGSCLLSMQLCCSSRTFLVAWRSALSTTSLLCSVVTLCLSFDTLLKRFFSSMLSDMRTPCTGSTQLGQFTDVLMDDTHHS